MTAEQRPENRSKHQGTPQVSPTEHALNEATGPLLGSGFRFLNKVRLPLAGLTVLGGYGAKQILDHQHVSAAEVINEAANRATVTRVMSSEDLAAVGWVLSGSLNAGPENLVDKVENSSQLNIPEARALLDGRDGVEDGKIAFEIDLGSSVDGEVQEAFDLTPGKSWGLTDALIDGQVDDYHWVDPGERVSFEIDNEDAQAAIDAGIDLPVQYTENTSQVGPDGAVAIGSAVSNPDTGSGYDGQGAEGIVSADVDANADSIEDASTQTDNGSEEARVAGLEPVPPVSDPITEPVLDPIPAPPPSDEGPPLESTPDPEPAPEVTPPTEPPPEVTPPTEPPPEATPTIPTSTSTPPATKTPPSTKTPPATNTVPPTRTPTNTPTRTPSATPENTPTVPPPSATPESTPTKGATASPTPTRTNRPEASPTVTKSPTPRPTASRTPVMPVKLPDTGEGGNGSSTEWGLFWLIAAGLLGLTGITAFRLSTRRPDLGSLNRKNSLKRKLDSDDDEDDEDSEENTEENSR